MQILIFGASGKTGRELVRQGLTLGHEITAFVRNPAKLDLQNNRLKIFQGDVTDRAAVENAVRGQEAVICALGGASLTRRDPSLNIGMHHILTSMEKEGVHRLVYLSADTVHAVRDELNPLRRYLIVPLILQKSGEDHEINECMIQNSRLEWVIIRPPMLTNGPQTGVYQSGLHLRARSVIPKISRRDLAEFMLKQIQENTYECQAPEVMYG